MTADDLSWSCLLCVTADLVCCCVIGASSVSSSSTRSTADTPASTAVNPSDTSINGSQVVAVGMPLATVSTVASGHQTPVMVSYVRKMKLINSC